jgi:hypothetical protein
MKRVLGLTIALLVFCGQVHAQTVVPGPQQPKFNSTFVRVTDQVVDEIVTDGTGKVVAVQAYTLPQLKDILTSLDTAYQTNRAKVLQAINMVTPQPTPAVPEKPTVKK